MAELDAPTPATAAVRNPAQQAQASTRTSEPPSGGQTEDPAKVRDMRIHAALCQLLDTVRMGDTGLEPIAISPVKIAVFEPDGAESGAPETPAVALDADLRRVIEAWPTMHPEARAEIVTLASRAQRWHEYATWARKAVGELIVTALNHGWDFKGRPRPAKTGSWYVAFRRPRPGGTDKQCFTVRIANHRRPRRKGCWHVTWEDDHENGLDFARNVLTDQTAGNAAAG